MKSIILITITLYISIPAWSHQAKDCETKNTPQTSWIHYLAFNTVTDFGTLIANLCLGINTQSGEVDGIYFIPDKGEHINLPKNELMNERLILESSDLPDGVRLVIRKTNLISIKIADIQRDQDQLIHRIELKFLRNLGKGLGKKDYRKLDFISVYNQSDKTVHSYLPWHGENIDFDHFDLILKTIPVSINRLEINYEQQSVISLKSRHIPRSDQIKIIQP